MTQPINPSKRAYDFDEKSPMGDPKRARLAEVPKPFESPISQKGRADFSRTGAFAQRRLKGRTLFSKTDAFAQRKITEIPKSTLTIENIVQLYGIDLELAPREEIDGIIEELLLLEYSFSSVHAVYAERIQKVRHYFKTLLFNPEISYEDLMAEIGAAQFFFARDPFYSLRITPPYIQVRISEMREEIKSLEKAHTLGDDFSSGVVHYLLAAVSSSNYFRQWTSSKSHVLYSLSDSLS